MTAIAEAESKIDLTDRLRAQGVWQAASKFKDERVKFYRAQGMKRQQAQEAAWADMAAAYPPPPPEPVVDDDLPEAVEGVETDDPLRAFRWVFAKLDHCEKGEVAPSAGALSLLKWARQNRDKFYPKWIDVEISHLSKREAARDEHDDACDMSDEELAKLCDQALADVYRRAGLSADGRSAAP